MSDSMFWSALCRRFEHIPRDVSNPDGVVRAHYLSTGWGPDGIDVTDLGSTADHGPYWYLAGGPNEDAQDEFMTAAALGAVAIGCPNTPDAWTQWLDCLRDENIGVSWSEISTSGADRQAFFGAVIGADDSRFDAANPGGMVDGREASVNDACGASIRFCRKLEAEALKQEIAARAAIAKPSGGTEGTSPHPSPSASSQSGHLITDGPIVESHVLIPVGTKITLETKRWRQLQLNLYRDKRRQSAADFADHSRLDQSTISAIVREDVKGKKLNDTSRARLIEVLGLSLAEWYAPVIT